MTVKESKQTVWKISGNNCSLNEITVEKNVKPGNEQVFWDIYFASPDGKKSFVAQYDSEDEARAFVERFLSNGNIRESQGIKISCAGWAILAWFHSEATRAR